MDENRMWNRERLESGKKCASKQMGKSKMSYQTEDHVGCRAELGVELWVEIGAKIPIAIPEPLTC